MKTPDTLDGSLHARREDGKRERERKERGKKERVRGGKLLMKNRNSSRVVWGRPIGSFHVKFALRI